MTGKSTWFWLFVAAVLLGFIMVFQRPMHKPPAGPAKVLPDLKPERVTAVQIMPKGQMPIRVERTNEGWRLAKPLVYPAQSVNVEGLLAVLAQLIPATHIMEKELTNRFNLEADFGFADPQATVILEAGEYNPKLRIGLKTPPGDQVFLQVVGQEGAYVVDADLLKLIPREANEWRDRTFVSLKGVAFDRIAVTNGPKMFILQSDSVSHLWRISAPPSDAWLRADNQKIEQALEQLDHVRVHQFLAEDGRTDLEALGLQPPELSAGFSRGTNLAIRLDFGKSPTNDTRLLYARRSDQTSIGTVLGEHLAAWRDSINDLRDPHLVVLTGPVETIVVRGEDNFSVQRQTTNGWLVAANGCPAFPADTELVKNLLGNLAEMRVAEFKKDNVTELGWAEYGLVAPRLQYALLGAASPARGTNQPLIAELRFGTNQDNTISARRTDENSVYSIKLADFDRLPTASWQLRQRRVWGFSEKEVARATIRREGRTREIMHNGPYEWSLAPGSQGIIEAVAVEETVRGVAQVAAAAWTARGEQAPAQFGITEQSLQVALELKDGTKTAVRFGKEAPSGNLYAAVTLEGQTWIMEFPFPLFRDVLNHLAPNIR
jgi:hypothetical protein